MAMSSPSTLHSLPVEIVADILSHLSAREVQRSRQLSHHFRDLVDHVDNIRPVAQLIQRRALARLRDLIAQTYIFPAEISFPEALRCWLTTRGIPRTPQDRVTDLWTFAEIWHSQRGRRSHVDEQAPWLLLYKTQSAAAAMLEVHLRQFHPELYNERELGGRLTMRSAVRLEFQSKFGPEVKRCYDWNNAMVDDWWRELHAHKAEGGYFAHARVWPGGRGVSIAPAWPLNSIAIMPHASQVDAICGSSELVQLLGVPPVPRRIGYYAENVWAWEQVREAVKEGKEMMPLVKAAVLEDLGIY
ncbi:hypothetical protein B0A50_03699 [Salinomyces thailandicus]|uniref:F-box domain-containing protein n=1 Tax=Salinomyces thailandicus TaxID=706561 RepID=A0A4V5N4U4_9PEZI|nr:hypothetical protein B0A50_03699 [Salinomyces thailandica]